MFAFVLEDRLELQRSSVCSVLDQQMEEEAAQTQSDQNRAERIYYIDYSLDCSQCNITAD
jgi:hypothetical protein